MRISQRVATAALLAAAAVPAAALAQYNGGWNQTYPGGRGYGNNGGRQSGGIIASVNGGDVRLTNGRNIFLENGTVINPRGTTLQAGQNISVIGTPGGNNAINASEIDVNGYANAGGYGNRGYGSGNYGNAGYGNAGRYGDGNGRWDRDDRDDRDRAGRWDRDDRDRDSRWDRDDRRWGRYSGKPANGTSTARPQPWHKGDDNDRNRH